MSDLAESHDELRPLMFAIAYRMLGSVAEAEDVVQEAFLRMHQSAADGVPDNPAAFATTVVTRLSIDTLRSARHRREQYVGTWLPEPLLDDDDDPAHRIVRDETVSSAFLVVLERLTPVERAVFLLREVFSHEYADVAAVVGKTDANCRQIFSRASRRLEQGEARFVPDPERHQQLTEQFLAAMGSADSSELERWLADDVVFYADGGGNAPAINAALHGPVAVARFLRALARQGARLGATLVPTAVGGYPAYRLLAADGALLGVLALHTHHGQVTALRNQINPDKLHHLGRVGDLSRLVAGGDQGAPFAGPAVG